MENEAKPAAADHDRKTRLNVAIPRSRALRLETIRFEHPGIWKSDGELAVEVLHLGMRAFDAGARPSPEPREKKTGGGYLTVSLSFEIAAWFDKGLASQPDAARSRRDLILEVLQLGMQTFEASALSSSLVQKVEAFLEGHPVIATACEYKSPADFIERAVEQIFGADLDQEPEYVWDAAHPDEARARDAWDRQYAEAHARGDRAKIAELVDEDERARAEGRPPWWRRPLE